ncbi:HNH endonuclease signature motif containing protein [Marihabitans asiaticum]|uniref:HNH endonuclease signature motif containing protein n=1 Tax=Marihabitans asiaticum TaxID=415218 RepID=UPI00119DD8A8|nr:HNH endonuclease signature motif containing protein [Marihabitans asiaticum]
MSTAAVANGWTGPAGPGLPAAVAAREVVDWLSTVGAESLAEAEALEVIGLLERAKGAAAAAQARLTVSFVKGRDAAVAAVEGSGEIDARTARQRRAAARSEVALARRCSPSQADRHVGLARALVDELPETMAALTAGDISEWRATVVARGTACLSRADRLEADRRLAPDLDRLGDRGIDRAARRVSAELDAESVVERHRRAVASRSVSVRPAPDGMAWLSILGPLVDVVGAHAALTAAEQARWVATGDPARDAARAGDERGRGAWMADTALERLSGRGEGEVQPVEIGLVMTPAALLPRLGDVSGGPCGHEASNGPVEVPGWGSIPGAAVREHLARLLEGPAAGAAEHNASGESAETSAERERRVWLRRLFTGPDGRDLVATDSRRRLFGGALRAMLMMRDPTCRIPWCDAPTREIDHVRAVADGGETSAANAMGVCSRHNLDKETPGWGVEVRRSGLDPGESTHMVRLATPTGVVYDAQAPPLRGHGTHPPPAEEAFSPLERYLEHLIAAAA